MFGSDSIGYEVPALLVGAVLVIALASLILHFLFPPAGDTSPRRDMPAKARRRCPTCQQELHEVERHGARIGDSSTLPRQSGTDTWLDPQSFNKE